MTSASPRRYAPRLPPEQRREQLLDAALDLALERGFHAVTVDGVARACGVTRPVVYGAFADRDALLGALADRSEERVLAALAPVLPDSLDGDPDDLLVAGLTAYLEAVRADPRTWRVVLLPPEGAPAEMATRIARQRGVVLAQLQRLTDWGLAERGGPDLDGELFARAVQALAEAAARLVLEDPLRWDVASFTLFARTALAALRPSRPGEEA